MKTVANILQTAILASIATQHEGPFSIFATVRGEEKCLSETASLTDAVARAKAMKRPLRVFANTGAVSVEVARVDAKGVAEKWSPAWETVAV